METQPPNNCLTPANQKAAVGGDFLSKKPKFDESLEDDVKSTPADPMAEETPADLTADDISSSGEGDEPRIIGKGERVSELANYMSDSSETDEPDPRYDYLYDTPEKRADRKNFQEYIKEYRRTKASRSCRTGVEDAIDFKNKQKNVKLKLLEIIKCNFSDPYFFYTTFRVVDENTGDESTYQAKVIHNYLNGNTQIHRFRIKPES